MRAEIQRRVVGEQEKKVLECLRQPEGANPSLASSRSLGTGCQARWTEDLAMGRQAEEVARNLAVGGRSVAYFLFHDNDSAGSWV